MTWFKQHYDAGQDLKLKADGDHSDSVIEIGRECGRVENTLIEMVQLLSSPAPSRRVLMERGVVFARVSDSSRQPEIQIFCVAVLP